MALDFEAVTSAVYGPDACAGKASGGEVLNPLAPTRSALACLPSSAKPTGGTCAHEREQCVPRVQGARVCVSRPLHPSEGFEGGACPGDYPDKLVHYRAVLDRRGCTACTCSGEGSCSVTMQAFAREAPSGEVPDACSGEPLSGDLYMAGGNSPDVQATDTITIGPGPFVACWNHGVFPNGPPLYNYRYTGVQVTAHAEPMTCAPVEPSAPYVTPLPSNPAGTWATTLQTDAVLTCCMAAEDPPAVP